MTASTKTAQDLSDREIEEIIDNELYKEPEDRSAECEAAFEEMTIRLIRGDWSWPSGNKPHNYEAAFRMST